VAYEKVITTTISPNYAGKWGKMYAIREVLQNALDLRTEQGVEFRVDWRDGIGVVEDHGPGLELRHLALGVSEKGEKAIGQFGEGLKLAALVFAREGAEFQIESGNMVITPYIVHSEDLGTDVLALRVVANGQVRRGTRVLFSCTREELTEAKEQFLSLGNHTEKVSDGMILPSGRIYFNGALVWKGTSLYSYDIKSKSVNRDRDVADPTVLQALVKNAISHVDSVRVAETILRELSKQDSACFEAGIYWYGFDVKGCKMSKPRAWKQAIHDLWGDRVCVTSGNTRVDSQADYEGWKVLHPHSNALGLFLGLGIPKAKDAVNSRDEHVVLDPMRDLRPDELDVLHKAIRLVNRHYRYTNDFLRSMQVFRGTYRPLSLKGVRVCKNLRKNGERANGLCDRGKEIIYIDRNVLLNLVRAVETLLHEAIHLYTGASDCTPEFQYEACLLAALSIAKGRR